MSHITHLYHLSALDFINTSAFPGMAPWLPSYTASDMLDGSTGVGKTLVLHYVTALTMRRKMHTAGALFSGRQPIQNALVPGGVTTLLSNTYPVTPNSSSHYDMFGPYNVSDTKAKFTELLNTVRDFIDTMYIPDVLTVATSYTNYWMMGQGCGNLLSYGDYPLDDNGTLAIKRGWTNTGLGYNSFDQANIREYVAYSYYDYPLLTSNDGALHPFDGATNPDMAPATGGSSHYSWLKAPRYMNGTTAMVCEVGPLARMAVTHAAGAANQTSATSRNTVPVVLSGGGTYKPSNLIANAVSFLNTTYGLTTAALFSPLGRHAARAFEAKYLADLMADLITQVDDTQAYTYKRIPKQISTGYGLTEAPRGALGHWIKIESKKIAKYQCVVPTTWNASPKDALDQNGPAEQALLWADKGGSIHNNIGTDATSQIVNILRLLHPFDFCIACAVHVVNPEGKETLKFAIDPQGRPMNVDLK